MRRTALISWLVILSATLGGGVWAAERIAARRGKFRATVALARRLAGILYAMLRDDTIYQPEKVAAGVARRPAA